MVTWAQICDDLSEWVEELGSHKWPVLVDQKPLLTTLTVFSDDALRDIHIGHTAFNEVAFYCLHLVEPRDIVAKDPLSLNDAFHILARHCEDRYGKHIRLYGGEIARAAWKIHGDSILEIQRGNTAIQVTYFTPQGRRLFFGTTHTRTHTLQRPPATSWDQFHANIIHTLLTINHGIILVISSPEGNPPFVQFASRGAYEGEEDLNVAEISLMGPTGAPFPLSPEHLKQLDMLRLQPADSYRRYCVEKPTMSGGFARNVADAWVYLLRDIAGIASPAELVYSAWQYPLIRSQRGGTQFSQGDPVTIDEGGADIELPSLGLRRISNAQARNAQS